MAKHKEHINDRVTWLEGFTESLSDRLEHRTAEARRYRRIAWGISLIGAASLLVVGMMI